jgi:hypothetical protein
LSIAEASRREAGEENNMIWDRSNIVSQTQNRIGTKQTQQQPAGIASNMTEIKYNKVTRNNPKRLSCAFCKLLYNFKIKQDTLLKSTTIDGVDSNTLVNLMTMVLV